MKKQWAKGEGQGRHKKEQCAHVQDVASLRAGIYVQEAYPVAVHGKGRGSDGEYGLQ